MSQVPLEKWIKEVKKRKKEIESFDLKDRLALVSSISKLHQDISASLQGWLAWLKNPQVMEKLGMEELKETFKIYKKLAIEFLDLDIKMSSIVLQKIKKRKTSKNKTKGRKTYIS